MRKGIFELIRGLFCFLKRGSNEIADYDRNEKLFLSETFYLYKIRSGNVILELEGNNWGGR
ncbi:hypothetical protein MFLO_09837 [Listeria floridensis FSL S10-1187]|uniref:Uncharacterized protein n=1 Tax=Listeria floridensis FSL S10-1187 TaxID=1265817 RepID=A0ABP3AX46_9LIST|nr:hypothetical protein MFLO_09837 [Listeria floridensis FSL S10-1187]